MVSRTIQLRVGGQTYRVVSSATESELQRLAAVVDERLQRLTPPGRAAQPQLILLAAMALAHDLEEERARVDSVRVRAKGALEKLLERVDGALSELPE